MERDETLAELRIAPARWGLGVALLYTLGLLLAALALRVPEMAPSARGLLMGLAAAALYLGERSRRVRHVTVLLRGDGLVDSTGRLIARFADIRSIERGALAFKPSNGFLLRLCRRGPRAWVPGLWWRTGRSVGIGGATRSGEAKFMAEAIAAKLAAR